MSCCGQKREALAASADTVAHSRFQPAPEAVRPAVTSPAVTLRSRKSGLTVHGPFTGKRYQFFGKGSMQAVDRRDANAMVATGALERVWG